MQHQSPRRSSTTSFSTAATHPDGPSAAGPVDGPAVTTTAAAGAGAGAGAAERSRLLLPLAEGLADATTLEDILAAVSHLTHTGLGTDHAGIAVRDPDTHRLTYRTIDAFSPAAHAQWADIAIFDDTPAAVAVTVGQALYYRDHDAMLHRHPMLHGLPVLAGTGARACLPLRAGGHTVGALFLGWPHPGDLDAETREVVDALCRYTAQALTRAQLLAQRRAVAEVLQQAMLTELPQPDHLQLHARYVPAADTVQVGGDWYDAVVMPDGATTLVIGDVVGHDVRAAATMGQLRSMTRTLAWAFQQPASRVLNKVDEAVAGLRMDALATCLLARIEQDEADAVIGMRRLRWSSAGHPPPLLIAADGTACFLTAHDAPNVPNAPAGHGDLPLGVTIDAERRDHLDALPPASTLLLFTDGLIERRDRGLAEGLEVLRCAAQHHAHLELSVLVEALLQELVHADAVGRDPRHSDDVAVLAVRMHPEDRPRPPEAGPSHL